MATLPQPQTLPQGQPQPHNEQHHDEQASSPQPKLRFETDRLIICSLAPSHSHDLFEYAQDPDIGPNAGWPVHKSHEETVEVIDKILLRSAEISRAHTQMYLNPYLSSSTAVFAIIWKENMKMIGSVGIKDQFSMKMLNFVELITEHPRSIHADQSPEAIKRLFFSGFDLDKVVDDVKQLYAVELGLEPQPTVEQCADTKSPTDGPARLCKALEIGYALNRSYWGLGVIPEAVRGLLDQYIWPHFAPPAVVVTCFTSNAQSQRVIEKIGGALIKTFPQSVYCGFNDTTHDCAVFAVLPPQQSQ